MADTTTTLPRLKQRYRDDIIAVIDGRPDLANSPFDDRMFMNLHV